jgi:hypothetical protein
VIRTGQLNGPTTVAMHGEVAKQQTLNVPDGDVLIGNTIYPRG